MTQYYNVLLAMSSSSSSQSQWHYTAVQLIWSLTSTQSVPFTEHVSVRYDSLNSYRAYSHTCICSFASWPICQIVLLKFFTSLPRQIQAVRKNEFRSFARALQINGNFFRLLLLVHKSNLRFKTQFGKLYGIKFWAKINCNSVCVNIKMRKSI